MHVVSALDKAGGKEVWRAGGIKDVRPDNPRYGRFIALWKRLPVSVTRWIGPSVVRGIP